PPSQAQNANAVYQSMQVTGLSSFAPGAGVHVELPYDVVPPATAQAAMKRSSMTSRLLGNRTSKLFRQPLFGIDAWAPAPAAGAWSRSRPSNASTKARSRPTVISN